MNPHGQPGDPNDGRSSWPAYQPGQPQPVPQNQSLPNRGAAPRPFQGPIHGGANPQQVLGNSAARPTYPTGPLPPNTRAPIPPRTADSSKILQGLWNWVVSILVVFFDLVAIAFFNLNYDENTLVLLWAMGGMGAAVVVGVMVFHRYSKTAIAFKASSALAFLFPISPLGALVVLQHVIRKAAVKETVLALAVSVAAIALFCVRDARLPIGQGIFDGPVVQGIEGAQTSVWQYIVWATVALAIPVALGTIQRFRGKVDVLSQESKELHEEAGDLKVELTRSQEREVIAREIHDTVAHHITRVAMQANLGEMRSNDPEAAKLFQDIRETSQGSMEEMRSLISSLRDSASEGYVGVTPTDLNAVRELVEKLRKDGIHVNADIAIDENYSTSSAAASATYRIVREGLTNAAKYSKETSVLLSLSAIQGVGIFVEITNTADATKQEQSSHTGTGSGLLGMTERAHQLGGYLSTSETEGVWRLKSFLPITERKGN